MVHCNIANCLDPTSQPALACIACNAQLHWACSGVSREAVKYASMFTAAMVCVCNTCRNTTFPDLINAMHRLNAKINDNTSRFDDLQQTLCTIKSKIGASLASCDSLVTVAEKCLSESNKVDRTLSQQTETLGTLARQSANIEANLLSFASVVDDIATAHSDSKKELSRLSAAHREFFSTWRSSGLQGNADSENQPDVHQAVLELGVKIDNVSATLLAAPRMHEPASQASSELERTVLAINDVITMTVTKAVALALDEVSNSVATTLLSRLDAQSTDLDSRLQSISDRMDELYTSVSNITAAASAGGRASDDVSILDELLLVPALPASMTSIIGISPATNLVSSAASSDPDKRDLLRDRSFVHFPSIEDGNPSSDHELMTTERCEFFRFPSIEDVDNAAPLIGGAISDDHSRRNTARRKATDKRRARRRSERTERRTKNRDLTTHPPSTVPTPTCPMSSIFVSGFANSTTEAAVYQYVSKRLKRENIHCRILLPRGADPTSRDRISFRVDVPSSLRYIAADQSFWPADCICREFTDDDVPHDLPGTALHSVGRTSVQRQPSPQREPQQQQSVSSSSCAHGVTWQGQQNGRFAERDVPGSSWVYVSGFTNNINAEQVRNYARAKFGSQDIECFALLPRGTDPATRRNLAFKLRVPTGTARAASSRYSWPSHIFSRAFLPDEDFRTCRQRLTRQQVHQLSH